MLKLDIKEKKYKDLELFSNFNLEIEEGSFNSFIGPSGCGKTTLLNIISSLDEDFLGNISFNRNEISFEIGFMFQDSRLLPWLSVKDNLLLVLKNKDEIFLVDELLKEVDLFSYKDSYIKELSGGMKRKVALCRAFLNRPKLVLLDEPFISLDAPTANELRELFYKFYKKYRPTVILVTHDLQEAISLSNRVIFFSKKPTSVILDYKIKKEFELISKELLSKELLKLSKEYPKILSGEI